MGTLTVLTALALAASTPVKLEQAVAAYDRAQVAGDLAALRRLVADDYILVNSAGGVETKTEFINETTAPGFKMEPFTVLKPVEIHWGKGAVMGGVVRLTVHDTGVVSSACLRFADIWSLRRGVWQVTYTQVARAKEAECR